MLMIKATLLNIQSYIAVPARVRFERLRRRIVVIFASSDCFRKKKVEDLIIVSRREV